MNRLKMLAVLSSLSVVAAAGVATAESGVENVGAATMAAAGAACAGNWKFEFETPMGPTTTMMKLTQNGDQLTGKASDPNGAEVDVSGTCKGDAIEVIQKVQSPMGELTLTFGGMVSGKSITGSVKLGEFGEAPFTGTKQ